MLHVSNTFLAMLEKPADNTPPNTGGVGFTLGASNSMGSYTQVLDGSADWPSGFGDGFGIWIQLINGFVTGQAHQILITLGIDLAGGTTYTDWISDLVMWGPSDFPGGGNQYYFPIRVPNGASIAVKGQDSHATPNASPKLWIKIPGKPTHPELVRVGTFVQSFGVDTANSTGTSVTAGTGAEGTYVQLGSALDKNIWYWEHGLTASATAVSATGYYTDIAVGDASNKRRVIRNARVWSDTTESSIKYVQGEYGDGAVGDLVYGRVQVGDNPAASGLAVAAYGVGG